MGECVCGVGTPKTLMTFRMNTFWEHLCHLSMVFFINDATFVLEDQTLVCAFRGAIFENVQAWTIPAKLAHFR